MKKINQKSVLIFLILLTLFVQLSCEKKSYMLIPPDRRFKVNWLDTLIFRSNLNNTDTLVVSSIYNFFYPNPFCGKYKDRSFMMEVIETTFKLVKNKYISQFVSINQYVDCQFETINEEYIISVKFYKSIYNAQFIEIHNCKKIGNKKFSNVYEYNSELLIKKIYFNFKYCILGYETQEGEVFIRENI